jgi:PAS domain S-box-containing protein
MKPARTSSDGSIAGKSPFGNGLAWVVFILALALTGFYTFTVSQTVKEKAQAQLIVECKEIIARLDARLESHAQLLRTGSAFFESSDTVTRSDWHTFITHQQIGKNMPGVLGVGYTILVRQQALKKFEEHTRSEGFYNFKVSPEGVREIYSSLIYIEPFTGNNQRSIGTDMYAFAAQRAAMEKARDMNIASFASMLGNSDKPFSKSRNDAILFIPVYFREMPTNTITERRKAIKGWVFSSYNISVFITGLLKNYEKNDKSHIYLQIYAGKTMSQESLMFDNEKGNPIKPEPNYVLTAQFPYSFNGTFCTLYFKQPKHASMFFLDEKVGWVLFVGILISLLFFVLAISLINSHTRLQGSIRLAATIQERLDKHIALYKAIPDALFVTDSKTGQIEEINNKASEQYGYDERELKGMNESGILVQPGHIGFPDFPSQLFTYNIYHQKKDATVFPVEISSSTFEVDGVGKTISVARDISERLKVEADLRIKNEVFENSTAALAITDKKGRLSHVNKAFVKMWGYSSDQNLLGKNFGLFFANQDDAKQVTNTLNQGQFWQGEYNAKKQDGSVFMVRGLATSLRNKDNEIIGYQSTNLDITKEKENENKLLEYKTAIDQASDGIAIVGLDREISFLNQSWFKMHGYGKDELTDYSMNRFHTDEQLSEEVEPLFETLYENGFHSGEVGHKRKDGTTFPTWMSTTVLKGHDQQPVGYLGVVQDITLEKAAEAELKKSKQHYQTLVENANDAIVVTISDNIVFANSRFFEIIALPNGETLPGNFLKFIHPEDLESLMENYMQLYKGKKMQKCTSRLVSCNGQTKWAEFSAIIIDWDDNTAVINFIDDITERKISAEALQATLKEKEILLREVHHRVKNNLQVVSSLLNLQANRISDKAVKDLLSQSRNRIRSIALVHEKLYQSGNFAEVNLKEYSHSLLTELFRLYISDPEKIHIRTEIADVNIPLIYAIPCGLILNEIISNSLKYAFPENWEPETKPEIYISCKSLPNNYLQLCAGDNGIGLPQGYTLTGLNSMGLYLVHILSTEQLDGKLEIDTKKGSNFTITFNGGLKT